MSAEAPNCVGVRADLAAFALDALEAGEAEVVRSHVVRCDACRRELAEFCRISAGLALTAPGREPPAELRDRVLDAARRPWGPEPAHPTRRPGADPLPMPSPRRTGVAWWRWIAIGARLSPALSAAALAALVVVGVQLTAVERELATERAHREALEARLVATDLALAELARPGVLTRELTGAGPAPLASARIYLHPNSNTALLATSGLPAAEAGRVYQLWLIRDGKRTSGGTFVPDASGVATLVINAPAPLSEYQQVGITIEPVGGSPGPTGPRVLGGSL